MIEVRVKDAALRQAAGEGMDAFLQVFINATKEAIGGHLTAENMGELNTHQITLLAYDMMREEVMEGGFVQLIHNGLGSFIFLNPFAKAMRMWGAKEMCNLIYDARRLYEKYAEPLTKDCTDEEFMALYEQYGEFDELDDTFIEIEPEVTSIVAHYIDENLSGFATVES